MGMENFTRHQQGIIKRYYSNQDTIQLQKLGELVTELYLAEGKKRDKLWQQAAAAMGKLGVPAARVSHVMGSGDPAILAGVVKELSGK